MSKCCTMMKLPVSVCVLWGRNGSGGAEGSLVFPQIFPRDPRQKLTSWSHEMTGPSVERCQVAWTVPEFVEALRAAAGGPGLCSKTDSV